MSGLQYVIKADNFTSAIACAENQLEREGWTKADWYCDSYTPQGQFYVVEFRRNRHSVLA